MSLGETIYTMRQAKNLSQEDLAVMLNVSRQSVSKWENNSAVPDLEKIVKLSEIFEVSLDQLVKGKEYPQPQPTVQYIKTDISGRKLAGTILLCMAFLVVILFTLFNAFLAGLLFATPLLACGLICFICTRRVGLWCAWVVYFMVDLFLVWGTGISRSMVIHTLIWEASWNYARLLFSWAWLIVLIVLIIWTAISFQKVPRTKKQVLIAWGRYVLVMLIVVLWPYTSVYKHLTNTLYSLGLVFRLSSSVISWSKIITLTMAISYTVSYLKHQRTVKQ
ncbi:MAG: helix-turn-helix transcriptional regulator [Erysipelotrichales bacterium]|nr:helix-turn-helix transcriptional regulator [Erysipelotrichales bacterium]